MPEMPNPAAAAPAPSPGQSPPGSSPATMPVPNRGQEASALAGINVAVQLLMKLATQVGATSDVGKDVLKAVTMLSKHVPPGSTSPGVGNSSMMNMMREQQAQQPMSALMAARGGGQAPGAGAPPAPAAAA